MEYTYALSEIEHVAKSIVKQLTHDTIIFNAPMGAGKTTLIKSLCKELGIQDEVSSPTFSLVNEYSGKKGVLHFDLYRIEAVEELYGIGMEDYLDRPELKFIEWPDKAMSFLDEYHSIEIDIVDEKTRKLKFK